MKNTWVILIFLLFGSCTPEKKELFALTDSFVQSLQTTYERYGLFGGKEYLRITPDSLYQVMPMGRLINVKILKVVSNDVYRDLEKDLERHYKGDRRVRDIYINTMGTIMIDCRN